MEAFGTFSHFFRGLALYPPISQKEIIMQLLLLLLLIEMILILILYRRLRYYESRAAYHKMQKIHELKWFSPKILNEWLHF